MTRIKLWAVAMTGVLLATIISIVPAVAQDAAECRGGMPSYWQENAWPEPFLVPIKFQNPAKSNRTLVRPWTKFDDVFRYRNGRDQEGKIFPALRLKQVLNRNGNLLQGLARQTVAALLNAGQADNSFPASKYTVIKGFQTYWDGTYDMSKRKARKYFKAVLVDWNSQACPVVEPPAGS